MNILKNSEIEPRPYVKHRNSAKFEMQEIMYL